MIDSLLALGFGLVLGLLVGIAVGAIQAENVWRKRLKRRLGVAHATISCWRQRAFEAEARAETLKYTRESVQVNGGGE